MSGGRRRCLTAHVAIVMATRRRKEGLLGSLDRTVTEPRPGNGRVDRSSHATTFVDGERARRSFLTFPAEPGYPSSLHVAFITAPRRPVTLLTHPFSSYTPL
jgi:hypothetical protein